MEINTSNTNIVEAVNWKHLQSLDSSNYNVQDFRTSKHQKHNNNNNINGITKDFRRIERKKSYDKCESHWMGGDVYGKSRCFFRPI